MRFNNFLLDFFVGQVADNINFMAALSALRSRFFLFCKKKKSSTQVGLRAIRCYRSELVRIKFK